MAELILKQLYNNRCFSLLEFISSSIYDNQDHHVQFMECATSDYKNYVDKVFLAFPRFSTLQDSPDKLSLIPVLCQKDFVEFYSCSQSSFPSDMFGRKIFPKLVKEAPLIPIFNVELWDALYSHVGDIWLKFIFQYFSLFILFPQDCLLQISGMTVIDLYFEFKKNEKRKRKLEFQDVSINKRLKISEDACVAVIMPKPPCLNFYGVRLTIELLEMLYSKIVVMAFPRRHDLEKLKKAGLDEAHELIAIMFQNKKNVLMTATGKECILTDSTITSLKNENVLKIMQAFLRNHQKVHFLEMIVAHCPFDKDVMPTTKSYCSPNQICDFLGAVIYRVIPLELFGSKHNKRKMQGFCRVFVNASKGDHFSLGHLLYCMRIDDCKWIPEIISGEQRQIIFAVMMNWLFSDYLLAVLQGYYYITDIEGQKKRLFFYRKDVWEVLNSHLMMQLSGGKILQVKRSKKQAEEMETNCGEFACSGRARLLPKKLKSRLILNMKPSKTLLTCLRTYLCVLNYIVDRKFDAKSSMAGCSIPSLPNFHTMWQNFVKNHRTNSTLGCPTPMYFVKLDIHDCFSSINLDLLDKVMRDACQFAEDNGVQEVGVHTYFTLNKVSGRLVHQFKRIAVPKNECILAHLKNAGHRRCILVDPERITVISIQRMAENLILHFKNISVELGKYRFNLMQGLGQGSLLSPILSRLYYGHMENKFLGEFFSVPLDGELFVRYVDDYLFVFPEEEKAQTVLSLMHPGILEYNCGTSCTKLLTNFDVNSNEVQSYHTCAKKKSELIPWLGMLVNSKTLEISGDFSQYAGHSIAHTMTLDASLGKKGLRKKMLMLISPGNNCILFDKKINGKKTIIKNLYEYSLLNAFRMHSLSTKLSKFEGADKHPDFYAKMILVCVKHICISLYKLNSRGVIVYPLRNCVSKWICLQAFIAKLKRHGEKYHDVIQKISQRSNDFASKMGKNGTSYFHSAIGPKMPRVFKEMRV